MRKLFFSLLFLSASPVIGAPEKYVLKAQGLYCPAKYKESIEEIADANNERSLKRAVGAAVMSGECINSGIDVPVFIENVTQEKTRHGSPYFCYVRLGEHCRSCSTTSSVKTLAQIQSERTGDFNIVTDNDKLLFAKCKEGGQVYIEKGVQWRRRAQVIFGLEDPTGRAVAHDQERAVRDGCKGLDF